MSFPLDLWDISLWLAVTAIILLLTSELLSPYYRHINLFINKKNLRIAALTTGTLFLATAVVKVISMISTP